MASVEVVVFNCRLRLVLDEDVAEKLRSMGVDPVATAEIDIAQDYEVGELLSGGAVCPTDCRRVAEELIAFDPYNLIAKVEVLNDKLPCPG